MALDETTLNCPLSSMMTFLVLMPCRLAMIEGSVRRDPSSSSAIHGLCKQLISADLDLVVGKMLSKVKMIQDSGTETSAISEVLIRPLMMLYYMLVLS